MVKDFRNPGGGGLSGAVGFKGLEKTILDDCGLKRVKVATGGSTVEVGKGVK